MQRYKIPFNIKSMMDVVIEDKRPHLAQIAMELYSPNTLPYLIRTKIESLQDNEFISLYDLKKYAAEKGYSPISANIYETLFLLKTYLAMIVVEGRGKKAKIRQSIPEDFENGGCYAPIAH